MTHDLNGLSYQPGPPNVASRTFRTAMTDACSDRSADDDSAFGTRHCDEQLSKRDLWDVIDVVGAVNLLGVPAAVFEAFSSEPRRHVVEYLLRHDRSASVDELAMIVAASEDGVPWTAIAPQQQERVAVELHHAHLPKLADSGLIEWDRADGTVELTNE